MKIIIIEDEAAAYKNIKNLLLQIDPHIEILDHFDTVVDSVTWLRSHRPHLHGYPIGGRKLFQYFRMRHHRGSHHIHYRIRPICDQGIRGKQRRLSIEAYHVREHAKGTR